MRTLAIAPSSRGFGYAVLEGERQLVDWGSRSVKKEDKNKQSVEKVEQLIAQYEPDCLAMPDVNAKGSKRHKRIRELNQKIVALAQSRKLKTRLISSKQMKQALSHDERVTRHDLATTIAERFPEELGLRQPPKRRAWEGEDARMDYFEAVGLAFTFQSRQTNGDAS